MNFLALIGIRRIRFNSTLPRVPRSRMRRELLTIAWVAGVVMGNLSLSAETPNTMLEIPDWTTADF